MASLSYSMPMNSVPTNSMVVSANTMSLLEPTVQSSYASPNEFKRPKNKASTESVVPQSNQRRPKSVEKSNTSVDLKRTEFMRNSSLQTSIGTVLDAPRDIPVEGILVQL
jgi:hypothetical protein